MTNAGDENVTSDRKSPLDHLIYFCLTNKLVVVLMVVFFLVWGVIVAPFDWQIDALPRNPVAVDAIPDIGENQQIVFTEWMGRSPQDVEDQISYPMTVALLGIPGVKTIRSFSFFGFSSIYVIFKEDVDFYWSRSRILEKLNSLPSGTLPTSVQPTLGPDATALGQVYWYTLEGRDPDGNPEGGWDLHELRTIQDWYVRYALQAADGVSEAASIGGFVQEYQVDVDPDAMRANNVTLADVFDTVRGSNIDVGARTIELNSVEYVIRGLGFIEGVEDLEKAVVKVADNVPIRVRDVANVTLGPALRRGALDKAGAEAVGGVVVARYGDNPLAVIKNVKAKIEEISPGLPSKVVVDYRQATRDEILSYADEHAFEAYDGPNLHQDNWSAHLASMNRSEWPEWANTSKVTVVPFYDRTGLIYETLGTLNTALVQEILITIIVVLVMVRHLRSSILISSLLPLAVFMCFIAMKQFGVDANIVALSGIAIAIGTMVDMGVILTENILRHLAEANKKEDRLQVVYRASSEVGGAVLTAVATTIISFLPVFTMTGAEGKLFKPLAFTKSFALIASVIVALTIIPPAAHVLLAGSFSSALLKRWILGGLAVAGVLIGLLLNSWLIGIVVVVVALYNLVEDKLPKRMSSAGPLIATIIAVIIVGLYLTQDWMPLGPDSGIVRNLLFVAIITGGLLGFFQVFQHFYSPMLRWCLDNKITYMSIPTVIVVLGLSAWLGFHVVFGWIPAAAAQVGISQERVTQSRLWEGATNVFPGFGKEFMPPLDEGSYLFMPTTMPHASIGEALDVLQKQDMGINTIPEVESVVGKIGRVESPLDPAPISMIETVINYHPEYVLDKNGHRVNFRYDKVAQAFTRDEQGMLIPDEKGRPFRQWRDHIRTPDDIWNEIVAAAEIPGTTSAPRLQPIAARIVMLQSGMRAPMGLKIKGPDLKTIESVGFEIERFLKEVPGVEPSAVFADRIVGKPYLEFDIDLDAISRHGLKVQQVQDVIEVAIGGRRTTMTVEGRERYPVRVRYMRELRDEIEALERIIVAAPDGSQIPIEQLAELRFVRGPQVIKSEDTFLTGYVLFDKQPGFAEVDVVESCKAYLEARIASGEFVLPAGVSYSFAGNYENQLRAQRTLSVVMPLALFAIFLILYLQFRSIPTTALIFVGILLAWAGGFLMIWAYAQPWFLNVELMGTNLRELFNVSAVNMSVAIWVGFLALFGIASDDGVVMATYLDQTFKKQRPGTKADIREATAVGAQRRIRPCLMTSATTILALIPILTSVGRGSDVMLPMAIPSFGGMFIVLISVFQVPVLYCWIEELKLKFVSSDDQSSE